MPISTRLPAERLQKQEKFSKSYCWIIHQKSQEPLQGLPGEIGPQYNNYQIIWLCIIILGHLLLISWLPSGHGNNVHAARANYRYFNFLTIFYFCNYMTLQQDNSSLTWLLFKYTKEFNRICFFVNSEQFIKSLLDLHFTNFPAYSAAEYSHL